MADKLKKIDKEFCWTDESVNVYGYRCLTSGCLIDEVKKNPIGFKMHNRENGVVVRWEDFREEGGKIYAKPVINLSHPDGERTVEEIENGFLNGASAGRIVCLEASDDPKLMVKGQTGPTVTKWFPREISLVDIPGNYNALANLYDENGDELDLADFLKPKNVDMSKNILVADSVLTALNLADTATQGDFDGAFQDLAAAAAKVPKLTQDLADMARERDSAKTSLENLQKETVKNKVQDLIDKGKSEKKLTNELATTLQKDYAENPEGLKNLIDSMTAQVRITDNLGDDPAERAKYEGRTWDDLYASDDLKTVSAKFPDLYEKLRNEKYPNQSK